jgi:hypothetical protein
MMGHTLVVVFNVTCPGVVSEARARRARWHRGDSGDEFGQGATGRGRAQVLPLLW